MKQEDRQEILLQQLSARLQYGLILHIEFNDGSGVILDKAKLVSVDIEKKEITVKNFDIFRTTIKLDEVLVRPYLRRMMSMTNKEEREYDEIFPNDTFFNPMGIGKIVKWFYENKFDFENLIESGIAIDAKDLYYEIDQIDKKVNEIKRHILGHRFSKSEKKAIRKQSIIVEPGDKVVKISGKPFKSGQRINTVKEIVKHPYKNNKVTGEPVDAYTFYEDDSVVEENVCTRALLDNTEDKKMSLYEILQILKSNTGFILEYTNGFFHGYGSIYKTNNLEETYSIKKESLEKSIPWTKTVSNPRNPKTDEYPDTDGDYITMLDCDGHAVLVNTYRNRHWKLYDKTHVKWWMPLSVLQEDLF